MTGEARTPPHWPADGRFWLALLAGPLCWALMVVAGLPLSERNPAWTTLLTIVLLSPIVEEYVFRGVLQGYLLSRPAFTRRIVGISLANLFTSLVFAAAHLWHQPPQWAAAIIVPSLVFGWSRERHASVIPPMLLHIVYNAGFVWLFV